MPNNFFQFKQFKVTQKEVGMKVTTEGCLFGAWVCQNIASKPQRVLDIGTGSGLLSLMLAQETPESKIIAIDINIDAYEEAKNNFLNSPWAKRLKAENVAVQELISDKEFDLIICNPPFYSANQKGKDENKNQAMHDDSLTIKELALAIKKHLNKSGSVWVLYPEYEMELFTSEMKNVGLNVISKVLIRNKPNGPIIRVFSQFGFHKAEITIQDLSIRNGDQEYSESFINLLQKFYLHL